MAVYDLKYVVANVMLGGNTIDEREFVPLLNQAINGYRELNLHNLITTSIQTQRLTINPNTNIACLPDDYLSWYKVGVCRKFWDGACFREHIINLDYNEDMVGHCDEFNHCDCNQATFNAGLAESEGRINTDPAQYGYAGFMYYMPRVNNGQYTAGIYSASSHVYRGSFIVDLRQRIIRFSSCIHSCHEAIIEYRSTGLSDMGNAIIDEGAIPALLEYIKWRKAEMEKDFRAAQYFRQQYATAATALSVRTGAMTDKQWYTTFRESYRQTPKG